MKNIKTILFRLALFAIVSTATLAVAPELHAQSQQDSSYFTFTPGAAETHFGNLQTRMKGFSVIILLCMAVIAAIMATMGKTNWAINVIIAAVVLFGLTWIILLAAEGLQ